MMGKRKPLSNLEIGINGGEILFKEWLERRKQKKQRKREMFIEKQRHIMMEVENEPYVEINRQKMHSNSVFHNVEEHYIPSRILPRGKHQQYCKHDGTRLRRVKNFDFDSTTSEKILHTTNWLRCADEHTISVPHNHPDKGFCTICGILEADYDW